MRRFLLVAALVFCLPMAGYAQLAQSFYNITNIKTDVLPNAIRITVETDGNVEMGTDVLDFLDLGTNQDRFSLLSLRRFRLRFVGAKAKIPAFVEIGKYPVDSVNVTLARDKFKFPFYYRRDDFDPEKESATPALDLEFRFYVPIKVPYFTFQFGEYYGWSFGSPVVLKPREASISVGPDRRSIIILVMNDRAEINRNPNAMRRSPPEDWQHHLKITASPTSRTQFTVDALHTPLAVVLSHIAQTTQLRLEAQPDVADRDITLFLPNGDLAGLIRALSVGYGLSIASQPESEGNSLLIGATSTTLVSERIPVRYSSPDNLRLLLPDFLLPYLRADVENNALVVTGSPALIGKVQEDVKRLDVAPTQVRVEAQAYEIEDTSEAAFALSMLFSQGKLAFDTNAGAVVTTLTTAQKEQYQANLTALAARGQVKLAAKPSVVVQSGNSGTLFFGQTRFLQVLTGGSGTQNAQVIQIPVGTTIKVTPTAITDPNADILLELSPRFSTVDGIEIGTGLPTLGIREVQSTMRVHPGDTILVAGLLSESQAGTRRGIFGFGAKRHDKRSAVLAVFVTAKRVSGG